MGKSIRILKKLISLFIIFTLSINVCAATVSDNDGSAFITKAEFDSLKNSFQSQIDQYNTSIDAKIDEAISNYLTGLIITTKYDLHSNINDLKDNLRIFSRCNNASALTTGTTFRFNGAMWLVAAYSRLSGTQKDLKQGMIRASIKASNPDNTRLTWRTKDNGETDYKVMLEEKTYGGVKYYYPYYGYRLKIEHWMGVVSAVVARNIANVEPVNTKTSLEWTSDVTEPKTELDSSSEWTDFYSGDKPIIVKSHTSNEYDAKMNHPPFKYLIGYATPTLLDSNTYGVIYSNRDSYDDDTTYYSATWDDGDVTTFKYAPDAAATVVSDNLSTTLKYRVQKVYTVKYKDFINEDLSDRMNEPITRCDGLPICKTSDKGKVTIKLDLESVDCSPSGTATDLSDVTYIVEIKGSKWGTVSPTSTKQPDSLYYKNNVTEGELEIKINKDNNTETTYWLKIVPSKHQSGTKVTFKEASIEIER
ncbi:MAG: hypothetical protein IJP71_00505 [Lachnospiraceae bacterium]|nr:hypothetical protein [Lachnospiraceae bacterium]